MALWEDSFPLLCVSAPFLTPSHSSRVFDEPALSQRNLKSVTRAESSLELPPALLLAPSLPSYYIVPSSDFKCSRPNSLPGNRITFHVLSSSAEGLFPRAQGNSVHRHNVLFPFSRLRREGSAVRRGLEVSVGFGGLRASPVQCCRKTAGCAGLWGRSAHGCERGGLAQSCGFCAVGAM